MSVIDVFTLRDRLRVQTGPTHEALDATVSGFDFAARQGVIDFLWMQAAALGQLDGEALETPLLRMIADLQARALEDLAAVGQPPPGGTYRIAFHPVACDYVLSGSRLGHRVLCRRWAAHATTTGVGGAFFCAPDYGEMWQTFCQGAGRQAGYGAEADIIVDDAMALFDLFHHAAERAACLADGVEVG